MRWWRRLTLRARLTVIGTVGLAVGLAVGGLLINIVLHYVLIRSVDESSRSTATDVATLVEEEHLSYPLPSAGTAVVQVLDSSGRVRDASPYADQLVSMLRPNEIAQVRAGQVVEIPGDQVGVDGNIRVVAQAVDTDDGPRLVLVGSPTRTVEQAADTVR